MSMVEMPDNLPVPEALYSCAHCCDEYLERGTKKEIGDAEIQDHS